jgi:hypothetical protein
MRQPLVPACRLGAAGGQVLLMGLILGAGTGGLLLLLAATQQQDSM